MRTLRKQQRGQVTVETAVLFGFVVAGLVAMAVYLQRGVQGGMKSNADSIGTQFANNDPWESHTKSRTVETPDDVVTNQNSVNCQGLDGAPQATGCDGATNPEGWE